jgi:hypothetical protein
MISVMGVSVALFLGSLVALLFARRRLGRALETERLDRHVTRELAQFDQRCAQRERSEGEGPPRPEAGSP